MVTQSHAMVCRSCWKALHLCVDCRRDMTPFRNEARNDGLMLRHWRKRDTSAPNFPATPADSNAASEMETDEKPAKMEAYPFTKFNIKIGGPSYTEEQYETHLKSDKWSKEETDYLVNLAVEYDLRWVIIADRYDYKPSERPAEGDAMAITVQAKSRTMEDMKARYYDVAAKIMVLLHPLTGMSTSEFDLHEKMTKFDPARETTRKKLAEGLLHRTPDEIKEEEILLGELKRIVTNEERFSRERKELYERLQAPQSTSSTQMYQSSHELTELMKTLLNVDKNNKKRRSLMGPGGDGISSPGGTSSQNFSGPGDLRQRHSLSGATDKKGSLSGSAGGGQRPLTAREEIKFGVSHHERLTAGVTFRHEKITKLAQAKSNVQSTKIAAALTELGIPPRLVMPTTRVCAEYERLIGSVNMLLDVRKVGEKVENEIRVLRAAKREDDGEQSEQPATSDAPEPVEAKEEAGNEEIGARDEEDEDDSDNDNNSEAGDNENDEDSDNDDDAGGQPTNDYEAPEPVVAAVDDDDDDDEDEEQDEAATGEGGDGVDGANGERSGSVATTARSRKRSASVMSAVSGGSLKRARK